MHCGAGSSPGPARPGSGDHEDAVSRPAGTPRHQVIQALDRLPCPASIAIRLYASSEVGNRPMATVDVLIPTVGRPTALAITLTSLLGQTFRDFDVVVSDQSEDEVAAGSEELQVLFDALRWHGHG